MAVPEEHTQEDDGDRDVEHDEEFVGAAAEWTQGVDAKEQDRDKGSNT